MRRWERLWPVVWSLGWGAAAASAAWHKWQAPAGLALGLALLPTTVWLASPRPWLGLVGAALTYSLMARWPHGSLCAPVAVVWWTARVTWDWAAGRPLTVEPAAAATLAGGLSWPWVGPLVGLLCLPAGWLLSSHTALPWTGRLSYAVDRLCQPWLRGLISSSRLSQPHSTSDWEQVVRTAGELDQSLSARSATRPRRTLPRGVDPSGPPATA